MAKTYAQIQAQIDKLTREAEALKTKEAPGVIDRIRGAIAHYGLTADDLFGPQRARQAKAGKPARSGKAAGAVKRAAAGRNGGSKARTPSPAKFQDEAGHQWSGVGKRPNWFKAALAAGKTADDLRIKPPAES